MKYKNLKPCPNNGVRCGNSSACFPKGTICKENKSKNNITKNPRAIIDDVRVAEKQTQGSDSSQANITINNGTNNSILNKIKASTKAIPWKALVAAGTITTVVGGSLLYLKVKDNKTKALYPTKYENTQAPDNLTLLKKTLDVSSLPSDDSAAEENQRMFEKKSKGLGTTAKIDNESKLPYNEEQFRSNQQQQKLYNHKLAREWAWDVLNDKDTIILDLETTSLISGLDPYTPEAYRKVRANVPGIIQIGMIETSTNNSLDIKLNPGRKLPRIAQEITDNNGKNLDKYASFKDYYPKLNTLLEGKTVLAFNARFDMTVIDSLCEENNLPLINYKNRPALNQPMDNDSDVMHWYALYMGKGARSDFKDGKYEPLQGLAYASLPKLPGQKAHDARSDCWSTLDVLRVMANGEKPRDMKVEEAKAWGKLMGEDSIEASTIKKTNINKRNSVYEKPEAVAQDVKNISPADTIISNALSLKDTSKKVSSNVSDTYDAYSTWGNTAIVEEDINYSKQKRSSSSYNIKPLISDKEQEENELKREDLKLYIKKYSNKIADTIINEALS